MNSRKPYEPPAIVHSGPIDVGIVNDALVSSVIPTTLAVSVALSYAIDRIEPAIAAMIYPNRARLSWVSLPKTVQGMFGTICAELRLGDVSTDLVRKALFR